MTKLKKLFAEIKIKNVLFILLAGIINACGVGLLLVPAKIIDGGISGLSFLISMLTPVPLTVCLIIFNLPFFIFGYRKMGFKFVIYSLISIFTYSLFVFLFNTVFKLSGENVDKSIITNNILLASIFGGLLSGIGSGLTIRSGGSLDGIEVAAVLTHKKLGITVGQFVMVFNIIIFLIAGFVIGFDYPLFSIIAYTVGIKAVDGIVEGLDKAKAMMIITTKGTDVASAISNKMGRGVTIIDGKGYFSQENKSVIYYIVNRFQIMKVKEVVQEVDNSAFITISDVSEVIGSNIKFRK